MKVRFFDGTEVPVTKVSSQYSLGIPSVDADEVAKFQALLTTENLSKFQIIDDEDGDTVKFEAENYKFHGFAPDGMETEEKTETNFILAPLTENELEIIKLKKEKSILEGAIEDLAGIVADLMGGE